MKIEFELQSVILRNEDIQEKFPALVPMINSYLATQRTPKRRKRKNKKTVGPLIQEIIDSIDN